MRLYVGLLAGLATVSLVLFLLVVQLGDDGDGGESACTGPECPIEPCDTDLTGDGVVDDRDLDVLRPLLQEPSDGNEQFNFHPDAVIDGQDMIALLSLSTFCPSLAVTPTAALTSAPTPFPACMRTLPSLNDEPLTQSAFQAADAGLATTIESAKADDADEAEAAFFGLPHDLTHNVDSPIRELDESLAIRLCNEVVVMEEELAGNQDPSVIEEQARKIREILTIIAAALGMQLQ